MRDSPHPHTSKRKAPWKATTRSLIRWSAPSIPGNRSNKSPIHRTNLRTMTAKNRQRNGEKSAASGPDDAPKKSQANSGASAGAAHGAQRSRPRSRSFLGVLGTAVFYAAVIGAAGFAAFHLQKVVEQMQQASARQEESARQNADMATKLDGVVLQVGKTGKHVTLTTRMFTIVSRDLRKSAGRKI